MRKTEIGGNMGKIILERAEKVAEEVIKRLAPYCKTKPDGSPYIEVVGSIRRRCPWVNDIDIVLVPSDSWNLKNEILYLCRPLSPKADGPKSMRIEIGAVQVDIYFADETTWATLLLIRTGSKESNIRLCSLAKRQGCHLAASGDGLFDKTGKRVAGDSEESIYQALGLSFQKPEDRK